MNVECGVFSFVTWGVFGSGLCVCGCVANALSVRAFQHGPRRPSSTLLQSLAATDLVLLFTVFVTDAVPYICDFARTCDNPWTTWPYIRYFWIITPVSHMCSIWFVTLIALNRYWAVCRPHDIGRVWTDGRTAVYLISAVVVVVTFNLPRFFEYRIVTSDVDNGTFVEERTAFGLTYSYKVVYKAMLVNIVLILLPLLTLMLLTCNILKRLRDNAKRLRNSVSRGSQEVTFVLVTVIVVAILCQTPLCAFHFVRYAHSYACGDTVFYLDNISKLLVNINATLNFIIYCLLSPRFRASLCASLCCCRGKPRDMDAGAQLMVAMNTLLPRRPRSNKSTEETHTPDSSP
ncbi:hypothetical protein NP493_168g03009 [Ridgeia piscesae]|uniref:G-protein coupled receptors family 1 profile domain-containing protein n=1 Tax=Ridgeia piscesae TaxID=27915 RepID=A0AAD9P3P8_RIDPI|nr:hypothetical protein NP493_168g03009 [Ridgeia piscesae]